MLDHAGRDGVALGEAREHVGIDGEPGATLADALGRQLQALEEHVAELRIGRDIERTAREFVDLLLERIGRRADLGPDAFEDGTIDQDAARLDDGKDARERHLDVAIERRRAGSGQFVVQHRTELQQGRGNGRGARVGISPLRRRQFAPEAIADQCVDRVVAARGIENVGGKRDVDHADARVGRPQVAISPEAVQVFLEVLDEHRATPAARSGEQLGDRAGDLRTEQYRGRGAGRDGDTARTPEKSRRGEGQSEHRRVGHAVLEHVGRDPLGRNLARRAAACGEKAAQDPVELQFLGQAAQLHRIRIGTAQVVDTQRKIHVGADRREKAAAACHVLAVGEQLPDALGATQIERRNLVESPVELVDRTEVRDETARGLLADAPHTRDVVDRVTHERHDVHDPVGRDAEAIADLGDAAAAVVHGVEQRQVGPDELHHVLVARHHDDLEATLERLSGERADDVVCLHPLDHEQRQPERLDHPAHERDLRDQVRRRLRPGRLVVLVGIVAERPPGRVEGHGDMRTGALPQEFHQHAGEAVGRTGGQSRAGRERRQGMEGPEEDPATVHQVQALRAGCVRHPDGLPDGPDRRPFRLAPTERGRSPDCTFTLTSRDLLIRPASNFPRPENVGTRR